MLHSQWFESAVLVAYGLGCCTIWRRGSRGRALKGLSLMLLGVAGVVTWKPEWLFLTLGAPAIVCLAAGLLLERDEDRARKVVAEQQQDI